MNTLQRYATPVMNTALFKTAFAALLIVVLSDCGGGIGGTGIGTQSVTASGVVTGFGSVFVNGVEFETSQATQVIIDDSPNRLESELVTRQVVTVEGTLNADQVTGTAERIVFADNVQGPVSHINSGTNILQVLGQTVVVIDITVLAGFASLAELTDGDILEVSGLVLGGGAIVATYIERQSPPVSSAEINVEGVIENLTATTFSLGNLSVDYSLVLPQNLPFGGLREGLFVEVKSIQLPDSATDVLIAMSVEEEDNFNPAPGELVLLEGFVAELAPDRFEISGHPVNFGNTTVFENGTAASLGINELIIVTGVARGDVIVASRIRFVLAQ